MNPQRDIKILTGLTVIHHIGISIMEFMNIGTRPHLNLIMSLGLALGLRLLVSLGILYGIYHGRNGLRKFWTGCCLVAILSFVYWFVQGSAQWEFVPTLILAVISIFILNRPHMVWYMDVQSEYERKFNKL